MPAGVVLAVIAIGVLEMLLTWAAVRRLALDPTPLERAFPQVEPRNLLRILAVLPLALAALQLLSVSGGAAAGGQQRVAQVLFYWGWWWSLVWLAVALWTASRNGLSLPGSAVLGTVLAVGILVLFASPAQFDAVFAAEGYGRALIIGLALVLMGATIAMRMRRAAPKS